MGSMAFFALSGSTTRPATSAPFRSRLIPQPGGSASFSALVGEEALHSRCEPILVERPDGPGVDFHLDAARSSSRNRMLSNQDLVSNDGQLERLDRLRFEGIGLHPGAEPVDALQGRLTADRDELDVGMHHFDRSVEVAAVERLITPAKPCDDLCV
jgi:hypothetical protein